MAILKCPSCGNNRYVEKDGVYKCTCCGNVREDDEISSDEEELLNRANDKRNAYDFDGAFEICSRLLAQNPDNKEANWCALLAKYQVVYLQNSEGKWVSTFMSPEADRPITSCEYYYKLSRRRQQEADAVEERRLIVLEEYGKIPNYDVFISYKQHAGSSKTQMTPESEWADEIYEDLTRENLRVFIDKKSLRGNAGWEPHIYSALRSAKFMIVLSSSLDNMNSPWVKNEWKRFIAFRKNDRTKTIAVACPKSSVSPVKLPDEAMRQVQMVNVEERGWRSELVMRAEEAMAGSKVVDATDLFTEATVALQKNKFALAKSKYEDIIKRDPRNARAYWGLLMCRYKAFDNYDIVKSRKKVDSCPEFKSAVEYANDKEYSEFKAVQRAQIKSETSGYARTNYEIYMAKSKVLRGFKKFVACLLALVILAGAAFGGLTYYNRKANEYTFVLDYGEATAGVASVIGYAGETIPKLPADLTVSDKYWLDFQGWYTDKDCGGTRVTGGDGKSDGILSSSLTSLGGESHSIKLYAGFKVHEYDVTFYDDDGHTVLKTVKAPYGTELATLCSGITVGDKKVLNWSKELGGSEYTDNVANDLALYAREFAVTVTYDSDGGSSVESELTRVGDKVKMPTPTKEYFEFLGWSYEGEIVDYGFTAPDKSITLTAMWKRTYFSVTYDSDGGNDIDPVMAKTSSTLALPTPTREYYRFMGWTYNGNKIEDDFSMPEKNITLVAQWERTHWFIDFKANGGNNVNRIAVKKGDSVKLPSNSRTGYTFNGWFDESNIQCPENVTPSADMVLTAKWTANQYTVIFDTDGGNDIASQQVTYDAKPVLPVPTKIVTETFTYKPSKNGSDTNFTIDKEYYFDGWYTSSGRQVTGHNGACLSGWSIAGTSTLTARYTQLTVHFSEAKNLTVDTGKYPLGATINLQTLFGVGSPMSYFKNLGYTKVKMDIFPKLHEKADGYQEMYICNSNSYKDAIWYKKDIEHTSGGKDTTTWTHKLQATVDIDNVKDTLYCIFDAHGSSSDTWVLDQLDIFFTIQK